MRILPLRRDDRSLMNSRTLGALDVSELGLGCMSMSELYGAVNETAAIATIHRALELGITLLDTADSYGPFTSERLRPPTSPSGRNTANLSTPGCSGRRGQRRRKAATYRDAGGRPV